MLERETINQPNETLIIRAIKDVLVDEGNGLRMEREDCVSRVVSRNRALLRDDIQRGIAKLIDEHELKETDKDGVKWLVLHND